MPRFQWLESARQDVRYAARGLRNSPGFTAAAVLSLTLGIGANTAIFQLVNAVRLRSIPVSKPGELALIDFAPRSMRSGWFSTRSARFTSAQWEEIRKRQQAFSTTFVWSATRFNLAAGGEARYAEGLYVSPEFFRGLGIPAIQGRTFLAEDDRPGCANPGAVVSYAFWQRELGGDPGAWVASVSWTAARFPVIGVTGRTSSGWRWATASTSPCRSVRTGCSPRTARPNRARELVACRHGPPEAGMDHRARECPHPGRLARHYGGIPADVLPARRCQAVPGEQADRHCGRNRCFGLARAITSSRSGCCWRPPVWCC